MLAALAVPKGTTAAMLWSLWDVLSLYHCVSQVVVTFFGSLWQDAELAWLHATHPVHCWDKPYQSCLQEMNVKQQRIADACARSVTTALSSFSHQNAGLEAFPAEKIHREEFMGSYYGTLEYRYRSSWYGTKKVYGFEG